MGNIEIPPGQWFYIRSVPHAATEEDLSQHFWETAGLYVPPENFAIRNDPKYGRTAVVSISRGTICELIKACIQSKTFHDYTMPFELFGTPRLGNKGY
jgi:hypothetical protein